MSFSFSPDPIKKNDKPAGPKSPTTSVMEKRPMVIGFAVSLVLLVGMWLGWEPTRAGVKGMMGRHYANAAKTAVEEKDWAAAFQAAFKARQWAPENLEVLHSLKDLLEQSNSDPAGLIQIFQQIEAQEKLDTEDLISLARAYLAVSKPHESRAVHERLPEQVRKRSDVVALLADILRAEGHQAEAQDLRKMAVQSAPESAEGTLSRAVEGIQGPFPEQRQAAREGLWQVARSSGVEAMEAVTRLTIDPALTVAEAEELLRIVNGHPHQAIHFRLGVVSALARLQPEKKKDYLAEEIQRFNEGAGNGDLQAIARWLALEKQHNLVIKLIPPKLASSSKVLYPILAQSLAEESRWGELKIMLTSGRPPVSPSRIAMWLAEAEAHLNPGSAEVRSQLQTALENARRENNQAALLALVNSAEKHNQPDIAMEACVGAATGEDSVSLQLLEKAAELARQQKDAGSLMDITRRLSELRPASSVFAGRLAYLRLLLGLEIETAISTAEAFSNKATLDDLPLPLLKSLADHRFGHSPLQDSGLSSLSNLDRLPPGQRAVAAGLLQMAGKADLAFQIAEKVPESLLLPEERIFLNKAR